MRLAAFLAAFFVAQLVAMQAWAQRKTEIQATDALITDVYRLPATLPGGAALRELSGLAWDASNRSLVGVTDRGLIVRWTIKLVYGRVDRITLLSAQRIASPKKLNAESIEWVASSAQPRGELRVVDEKSDVIHTVNSVGEITATSPLNKALVAQRPAGATSGVEAIAHHPRYGLLAVNQRGSAQDRASGTHRIFSEHGRQWAFQGKRNVNSSIKAMHLLNKRQLVLLEKTIDETRTMRYWLRILNLEKCSTAELCDPISLAIVNPRIADDDNFEALACVDSAYCVIATDDGKLAEPRTVIVVVKLGAQ